MPIPLCTDDCDQHMGGVGIYLTSYMVASDLLGIRYRGLFHLLGHALDRRLPGDLFYQRPKSNPGQLLEKPFATCRCRRCDRWLVPVHSEVLEVDK